MIYEYAIKNLIKNDKECTYKVRMNNIIINNNISMTRNLYKCDIGASSLIGAIILIYFRIIFLEIYNGRRRLLRSRSSTVDSDKAHSMLTLFVQSLLCWIINVARTYYCVIFL